MKINNYVRLVPSVSHCVWTCMSKCIHQTHITHAHGTHLMCLQSLMSFCGKKLHVLKVWGFADVFERKSKGKLLAQGKNRVCG